LLACAVAAGAVGAPGDAEALPEEQQFSAVTDAFVPVSELPSGPLQREYLGLYANADRAGAEPGRNILARGVRTSDGRVRAATETEVRRSVAILERMTAPAGGNATLETIAACESGGDPTAIGGGGLYRGKYQFTYGTWQSVGGSGDPAAAPEAEQDRRAALLLARDGVGHWPVCGG
jgi:Transglycosylase-like domain